MAALISSHGLGSATLLAGLGLLLGMRHSTDADHLVALATIVSKQRSIRGAALIGCMWGVGHTITIFVVGSLIILFSVTIPTRLGLGMEFCVAVMLVVLGLLNLTGHMQKWTERFTPLHTHVPRTSLREVSSFKAGADQLNVFHWVRPLVIGLVHGLAGSAAVALLVLSTIHNPWWATLYLLIFGVGTIVGMLLMTTAVAVPLAYNGQRFRRFNQRLVTASGVVSLCFGSFLMYELGIKGGLFSSHPTWTPH